VARKLKITLFSLLLAVLAAAVYHAYSGVTALADAGHAVATAQRQITALDSRLDALEQRQAYADSVDALLARARQLQLDGSRWSERKIRLSRDSVSRERAVELLGATVSSAQSIFIPNAYELSVQNPQQGLFQPPGWNARDVNFELSGTLHLLLEEAPQ